MFIIRFIRAFRGYVRFSATGVFLERFLNMAVHNRINIWDIEKNGTVLSACTDISSYKRLRPYAKKTSVRLRVRERHGLPFRLYRYKKRVGIMAGVAFFVLFLCAMGQFIWKIEIIGNSVVTSSEIMSVVSGFGLKTGTFKANINVRATERATLLSLQRLSWIAINIDGSTATIEVRERIMPPQMYPENDRACNIVAAKTGLITYMEVYEGQSLCKVGDTVKAGDIIISGIIEDKKQQDSYKHARGKIIAQVDLEIISEQPMIISEKLRTGEKKTRRYLRIFGVDMPLFIYYPFKIAYDLQRKTDEIKIGKIELPFFLLTEQYDFYITKKRRLTTQQAHNEAQKKLTEKEKSIIGNGKIINTQQSESLNGDMYKLTTKYLCNIDIAKEQEILKNE